MSVHKLFSRIIAPDITPDSKADRKSILHDHTYGISSDPLTRFACVFSALVHDVDHTGGYPTACWSRRASDPNNSPLSSLSLSGVPNTQLCKEEAPVAKAYNFSSVAEQNSVGLAWNLLMTERYKKLRRTIYTTEKEYNRFRKLVVSIVLATDISKSQYGTAGRERSSSVRSQVLSVSQF